MVDMYAWGAYAERCKGSSPFLGTIIRKTSYRESDRIFYWKKFRQLGLESELIPDNALNDIIIQ